MVAIGVPMTETLTTLIKLIEEDVPGMWGSILLLDDDGVHVHNGATPSLPVEYVNALEGLPIGPQAGSCGTAAYRKEAVIVEDIATDPLWEHYRSLAMQFGLRACWSTPIFDKQNQVLGTFAMYYRHPALPESYHQQLIDDATYLASIAISRERMERRLMVKESKLRLIYENVTDVLFFLSVESNDTFRFSSINYRFTEATGLTEKQVVGKLVQEVIPEPSLTLVLAKYQEAIRNKQSIRWEETTTYPSGNKIGEVSVTPVFDNDVCTSLVGMVHDITDLRKNEAKLRLAASAFESQDGMIITDSKANILSVNQAFSRITGYSAEEVIGKNPNILHSGRQDAGFYQTMWKIIQDTGRWSGEIWNKRKSGESYLEHLTIAAVKDDGGRVTNYVGSLLDITEQKQSQDRIQQLAYYDQLTGLPNRQLFRDRLEQDMKRVIRVKSSLALLFIDLDRFKEVNDTLGHDKGDILLNEAARRIRQHVRDSDTIARLGGDEFAIILPEYGDESSIDRVVQDVQRELETQFDLGDDNMVQISCSIGIVFYPQDANNIEDLLKHADQAMYAAKDAGRNRFSYFTPKMQQIARERLELRNDLRDALSRGEMEVHYQPIVELSSGRIVKAEALLRWHHPKRGTVSPALFIPLAEEFGIIHDLGNWVLMQSISAAADWRNRLGCEIQVSVNRSPAEFDKQEFLWIEALEAAGLPGSAITMEITEGLLIKKSELVQARLLECRNHGIEVSIDDFGTGYSALSYLKQFDIDYLKIDQSFVRNLTRDESDKALVEAIIVMAHKLKLRTIAEGVETEEQRNQLHAFGCDYVQGYLYSKPVPVHKFEALITTSKENPYSASNEWVTVSLANQRRH